MIISTTQEAVMGFRLFGFALDLCELASLGMFVLMIAFAAWAIGA